MKTRKIALSALCATLVIGAAASATFARPQGGHGGPGRMHGEAFIRLLKLADANKDGQVTKEEFTTAQEALFVAIDADKDDALTPKELREYREAKLEAFRQQHPRPEGEAPDEASAPDAPDDAAPPPPPERADRRHDKGRHGEARHHGGKDGPHDRKGHGKGWGKGHAGGILRMLDSDENGQVSKAEFTAGAEKLFERMDRNEDGVINIDDIPDRPFP